MSAYRRILAAVDGSSASDKGLREALHLAKAERARRAAADGIVREARRLRADLIVLGTHGRRGVRRLVVGSDAEQVVRKAAVPVLLVRGGSARPLERQA